MSYYNKTKAIITSILGLSIANITVAQINSTELSGQELDERVNTITTAVPFLMITPDARAAAMGDAGGAISADANAIHWNISKLAFAEKKVGISVSYTPWLRKLVPDINLAYLAGYYKADFGVLSGSLRYFSLGDIVFTDINGNTTGQFKPNEFAVDLGYAKALAEHFAMGGAVRYINSNLTNGTFVSGAATRPGRTVAVDLSATYNNDDVKLADKDADVTVGLAFSNIGGKISYSDNNSTQNTASYLPINMKLSAGFVVDMDKYNSIGIVADVNKLLVPTAPIYETDAAGNPIADDNGGFVIAEGKDPNRGVASGIFGSFNDAPGGGSEELHELNYAAGLEYWYNKLFAIRGGYFYEHPTKGSRQFITLGAGLRYNVFGLDFAYLIATQNQNPLANTLRFTLSFDFDAFGQQGTTVE